LSESLKISHQPTNRRKNESKCQ